MLFRLNKSLALLAGAAALALAGPAAAQTKWRP